jgi:hypothetical protein
MSLSSVSLFPRERIEAMTSLRFDFVKISVISLARIDRANFLVKAMPLRVAFNNESKD